MGISVSFGRWTMRKSVLALGASLVLAGIVGSAVAISPTVGVPIQWKGSAQFVAENIPSSAAIKLYAVPASRTLVLTDLIVSNSITTAGHFSIYIGTATCGFLSYKLQFVFVPPKDSKVISLQSGIPFGPGTSVCFLGGDGVFQVNGRGFLS